MPLNPKFAIVDRTITFEISMLTVTTELK